MTHAGPQSGQPLVEDLTARELEILALLAENNPNAEIAGALALSLNTVKWYNRQIYGKLGVGNRRQAVARARELGLLGAPAPPSAPRSNLPAPLTPFLGRHEERDDVCRRLRGGETRLLTITGPGGMGKTRLAIEVAACHLAQEREACQDGVFFVPLALVTDPASIVPSIAQATGFSFYQGGEPPEDQLLHYLRRRRMLLVLDNFEQIIEGAGIVARVLAAAPGIRVLVTSRTRLNILGEHVLPLAGLAYPDRALPLEEAGSFSGIQLFLQSAQRAWPACCLDAESLAPVVEICELVQGMPLGLELAAAWMAVMKPAEIAAEIKKSLDFLTTDAAGVPARQQSLRAVFDASWGLLAEEERQAVRGLSVFRGRFDRNAADAVCGVSPQALLALANKSWIQRLPDGAFVMHELLKQYGAGRLSADSELARAVRDSHSRYYCDWLSRQEAGLKSAAQQAVWTSIRGAIEDVQAACAWAAAQGQVERLERAANALGLFYYRGYGYAYPGRTVFLRLRDALANSERLQPAPEASHLLTMARYEMWYATCASLVGDQARARESISTGLALLEEPLLAGADTRLERAHMAHQLGYLALNHNAPAARQHFLESLAYYEGLGDKWGMAYALLGYGRAARNTNALEEAWRGLGQSLALHREIGNRLGQGEALALLGGLAIKRARFEEAERLIRESLGITSGTDRFGTAYVLGFLGWVQILTGRFREAGDSLAESIRIFSDLGIRMKAGRRNAFLVRAHLHRGAYGRAREEADAVLALAREVESAPGIGYAQLLLGEVALAEGNPAAAHAHVSESIRLAKETVTDQREAGFLAWLGLAARGLERRDEAWRHVPTALEYATWAGQFVEQMVALAGIALLLADEGEVERAVALYALALRHPFVARSKWFEDVIGRQIEAAAAGLPPDVVEAARERGRALDLESTVTELLEELRDET